MSIAVCLAGFGCVFLIVIFVLINKYSRRNKFGIKGMTRVFCCIILKGLYDAILMNEWMMHIYTVLCCVLLYTQSTLQSGVWGGGGSLLNHHQCAASTWMIIILCIWCNRICWHALMFKKHYISHTVHYCRSSMPRLSQTLRFLQNPSFWQAQSAPIGQLTWCVVIGRTPKHGNVTPLSIITSFSFQSKYKDSQ